jgi:hypothetical protein
VVYACNPSQHTGDGVRRIESSRPAWLHRKTHLKRRKEGRKAKNKNTIMQHFKKTNMNAKIIHGQQSIKVLLKTGVSLALT